ncbi:hypothetical protein ACLESD_14145 [Pyxidicoccus sp. 3LFB2]
MRNILVLGLTLASLAASAAEGWPAPYALEDQKGRTFRVIFGEKAPAGVKSRLGVMTLLGKKGTATARFQRLERVCADPCEGERPACHSVGVYTQEPGTGDVGEGLAALPGRLQGKLSLPPPAVPEPSPIAKQWISKDFQVPVDERTPPAPVVEGMLPQAFRWVPRADGSAGLDARHGGGPAFTAQFSLADCRQERQPPFTRLLCPTASLLYAEQRLLFASFDDYSAPTTEWLATFQTGEQELYLVRVGLKAHSVPGLLFREGDRWRLLLRPANYPLLC